MMIYLFLVRYVCVMNHYFPKDHQPSLLCTAAVSVNWSSTLNVQFPVSYFLCEIKLILFLFLACFKFPTKQQRYWSKTVTHSNIPVKCVFLSKHKCVHSEPDKQNYWYIIHPKLVICLGYPELYHNRKHMKQIATCMFNH